MKFFSLPDRAESGYIFVAFLFLVALLAATVSMFAMMALNNQRSATASLDQETSYQMAHAGLSVWMGKIREDYEINHMNTTLDDMTNYPWCEDMTAISAAAGLRQTRRKKNCVGASGGGSDPRETLEHPWGWGHEITAAADDDGDTLLLGEKVYLPSGELSAQKGDSGYFRIMRVIGSSGELEETPNNVETQCKDSGGPGELNVNTASYKFLKEVVYDTKGNTLTPEMARAIIKERSGSDQSVSDPDGDGEIELEEEVYTDGYPDPFDGKSDVCDFLDSNFSRFDKTKHCKPAEAVFPDNIHVISHKGKFCADIRGASIEIQEGAFSREVKVKSRYDLQVKVQRPTQNEDTLPIRVLTIQER